MRANKGQVNKITNEWKLKNEYAHMEGHPKKNKVVSREEGASHTSGPQMTNWKQET